MLQILQARVQQYMNQELPDVKAGFRKGRGTRDQIANICCIIEKARNSRKMSTSALLITPEPLTMWIRTTCGKFFKRWECQTTFPSSWEICTGQEATVRTRHETMDWFQFGKGVCQGCIFSSCLFNLYAEYIVRGYSTLRDPICFLLLCAFSQGLSVPYQFLQNSNAELHWVLRAETMGKSTCLDSLQWLPSVTFYLKDYPFCCN